MSLFSFFTKKQYFTAEQQLQLVEAINEAEKNTSGEVRVFVEGKCKYMDAVDRAREIFVNLQMDKTNDRNAVLLYIAVKDKQMAVFADEGIYQRLGKEYWNNEVNKILAEFRKDNYTQGICAVVKDIGEALKAEFPYDKVGDKNELPDEIIFGH